MKIKIKSQEVWYLSIESYQEIPFDIVGETIQKYKKAKTKPFLIIIYSSYSLRHDVRASLSSAGLPVILHDDKLSKLAQLRAE